MSKKSRLGNSKPASARQTFWLPIVAGGAILVLIVGLAFWWTSSSAALATAPQVGGGGPQLTVDRPVIDDGYVKFDTPVRAAFKLNNIGSQPLQILGEPQVELIEGC